MSTSEANIKLTCALLIASLAVAVASNATAQYACMAGGTGRDLL
jgi:hypothetical protein